MHSAVKIGMVTDPSHTLLFMEEDDWRGLNMNSWMCVPPNRWIDYVAGNHVTSSGVGHGDNVSFADGRAEFWIWQDEDTISLTYGSNWRFGQADPGSADIARIGPYMWAR